MSNQTNTNNSFNVMAIVSLATSLFGFAFVSSILGHVALGQIKRTGEKGREMAIAGLVVGYVTTALYVGLFALMVLAVLVSPDLSNY